MRQAQRRKLGEHMYEVMPLPAGKALVLSARLGKLLGGAVGKLSAAQSGGDMIEAIGEAFSGLAEKLDPDDFVSLVRAVTEGSRVEPSPGKSLLVSDVFDEHFSGRLDELFGLVKFALEVNYGPLDSVLRGALRRGGSTAER